MMLNPFSYWEILKTLQTQKVSLFLIKLIEQMLLRIEDERFHDEAQNWFHDIQLCHLLLIQGPIDVNQLPQDITHAYLLSENRLYYYQPPKLQRLPVHHEMLQNLRVTLEKRYEARLKSYPNHPNIRFVPWLFDEDVEQLLKSTACCFAVMMHPHYISQNERNEMFNKLENATFQAELFLHDKQWFLWDVKLNQLHTLQPKEPEHLRIFSDIEKALLDKTPYLLNAQEMSMLSNCSGVSLLGLEPKSCLPFDKFETNPQKIFQIKEIINALYLAARTFKAIEAGNIASPTTLLALYHKARTDGYYASTLLSRLDLDTFHHLLPEYEKSKKIWYMLLTFLNHYQESSENLTRFIQTFPVSYEMGKITSLLLNRMQLNAEKIDYSFLANFGGILPQKIKDLTDLLKKYTNALSETAPLHNKKQLEELQVCTYKLLNSIEYIQNNDAILSIISLNYVKLFRQIIKLVSSIIQEMGYLTDHTQEALRLHIHHIKYNYLLELFYISDKFEISLLLRPGTLSDTLLGLFQPFYQALIQWTQKKVQFKGEYARLTILEEADFIKKRIFAIEQQSNIAWTSGFMASIAKKMLSDFVQEINAIPKKQTLDQCSEDEKATLRKQFAHFAPWLKKHNSDAYNTLIENLKPNAQQKLAKKKRANPQSFLKCVLELQRNIERAITTANFELKIYQTAINHLQKKATPNLSQPIGDEISFDETKGLDVLPAQFTITENRDRYFIDASNLSLETLYTLFFHYKHRLKALEQAQAASLRFSEEINIYNPSTTIDNLNVKLQHTLAQLFYQFESFLISAMANHPVHSTRPSTLGHALRMLAHFQSATHIQIKDLLEDLPNLENYLSQAIEKAKTRQAFFLATLKEKILNEDLSATLVLDTTRSAYVLKHTEASKAIHTLRMDLLGEEKKLFRTSPIEPHGIREYGLMVLISDPHYLSSKKLTHLFSGKPSYVVFENTLFFIDSELNIHTLPIKRHLIPSAFKKLPANKLFKASLEDLKEIQKLSKHRAPIYCGLSLLSLSDEKIILKTVSPCWILKTTTEPFKLLQNYPYKIPKQTFIIYEKSLFYLNADDYLLSIELNTPLPEIFQDMKINTVYRATFDILQTIYETTGFHFLEPLIEKNTCYIQWDENFLYYFFLFPSLKIIGGKIQRDHEITLRLPPEKTDETNLCRYILTFALDEEKHPLNPMKLPPSELKRYFSYQNNGLILYQGKFYYLDQTEEILTLPNFPNKALKKLTDFFQTLPLNDVKFATPTELNWLNPLLKRNHYSNCYLLFEEKKALNFVYHNGLMYEVPLQNFSQFSMQLNALMPHPKKTSCLLTAKQIQTLITANSGFTSELNLGGLLSPAILETLDPKEKGLPFPNIELLTLNTTNAESKYLQYLFNGLYELESILQEIEALSTESFKETYMYHVLQIKNHIDGLIQQILLIKQDPWLQEIGKEIYQVILKRCDYLLQENKPYHENISSVLETLLRSVLLAPSMLEKFCKKNELSPELQIAITEKADNMYQNICRIIANSHSWFRLFLELPSTYKIFHDIREALSQFLALSYEEAYHHLEKIEEIYITKFLIHADTWEIRLSLRPGQFSSYLKSILEEYYKGFVFSFSLVSARQIKIINSTITFQKRIAYSEQQRNTLIAEQLTLTAHQKTLKTLNAMFFACKQKTTFFAAPPFLETLASYHEGGLQAFKQKFAAGYREIYPFLIKFAETNALKTPNMIEQLLYLDHFFIKLSSKPILQTLPNLGIPGKFTFAYYNNHLYFINLEENTISSYEITPHQEKKINQLLTPGKLDTSAIKNLYSLMKWPYSSDIENFYNLIKRLKSQISSCEIALTQIQKSLTLQVKLHLTQIQYLSHKQKETTQNNEENTTYYLDNLFKEELNRILTSELFFIYIGDEYKNRLKTKLENHCDSILKEIEKENDAKTSIRKKLLAKKSKFEQRENAVYSHLNTIIAALENFQNYLNEAKSQIENNLFETKETFEAKSSLIGQMLETAKDSQKTAEERIKILQEKNNITTQYTLASRRNLNLGSVNWFNRFFKSLLKHSRITVKPKNEICLEQLNKALENSPLPQPEHHHDNINELPNIIILAQPPMP